MTLFDMIALTLLGVSLLTGVMRGALREVSTVVAFTAAAFIALFALRFTGPIAAKTVHPAWAASGAAIVLVFLGAYIAFRMIGAGLIKSAHQVQTLNTLDRAVGGGFGAVRGLVLLGGLTLVFNAATPADRTPAWISDAKLYPLAQGSASMLRAVAPKGFALAGAITPKIKSAVADASADPSGAPPNGQTNTSDYHSASRRALDDVVGSKP